MTRYISSASEKRDIIHIPLQPVKSLLTLDCADGIKLPYRGFIACKLLDAISGTPETTECLFLIVNETSFHKSVPVTKVCNLAFRKPNYTHLGALHFVACVA